MDDKVVPRDQIYKPKFDNSNRVYSEMEINDNSFARKEGKKKSRVGRQGRVRGRGEALIGAYVMSQSLCDTGAFSLPPPAPKHEIRQKKKKSLPDASDLCGPRGR